jgi:murein DD-endopeptidase MepM/ murein hydrolase activator NlpD
LRIIDNKPKKPQRFKSIIMIASTFGVILLFAVVLFQANKRAIIPDEDAEAKLAEPVETLDIETIFTGTIKKNSSLYAELLNLELPPDLVGEVTSRFSKMFDLTRSQPGDSFKLFLDPNGKVMAFEYTTEDWKRYRLDRDNDSFVETVHDVGLDRSVETVEGKIETTLWEALEPLLPDMEVFFSMADIFGWEIDFLTEPRIGDTFRIVFEVFEKDGAFVKVGNILAAEYVLEGRTHRAFLYTDPDGRRDYYDENGYSLRKTLLKSPLNYRRISSKFSYRRLHPIYKIYRPHLGVDYAAAIGTPIVAAGEGYVLFKGKKRGFGNYLEIKHGHGLVTCYGHLRNFAKGIAKGRRVAQGQVIGYVGNTGESTGPHLDYRVRRSGSYVNPLKMTVPAAMPVEAEYMDDYSRTVAEYLPLIKSRTPERLLARVD